MTRAFCLVSFLFLAGGLLETGEAPREEGFVKIFDGKGLDGWKPFNEPGHGWGSVWQVKDGAIEGIQEWPGAWAILATQQEFGDFELRLEVKSDQPFDSGILLRSTFEGHGYEVLVQCRPDGDVGGIAGSRIGDSHVPAKDWKTAWKKDDYNEIRVTVRGDPPEIRTWLNGKPMAERKGESKDPRVGAKGHLALKIHGAEEAFGNKALFRNIRVLEIK